MTISCGALELVAILTTAPSLGAITIALCVLVGFVALIYLVAPSAEHWVRMISLRDTLNTFWSRVGGMGGNPYGEVMSVPPDEVG